MQDEARAPWQSFRQACETVSACTDTNLKILRQLTDFSANVAKESISLGATLQTSTLEAWQAGQAYALRRLSALPEAPANPMAYYQSSAQEGVANAAQGWQLLQGNTQAVVSAMEQYWITLLQTSGSLQASYTHLADKLKSLYGTA